MANRTCTCTGTVRDANAFDQFTSGSFPGACGSRDGDQGTVQIEVPDGLPDEAAASVAASGASLDPDTITCECERNQ